MSLFSRREFIRKSAAGASAVALTSGVARGFPANEKVHLGWIGYGGRATGLMQHMLERCPDAAHVAICDLKPDRVEAGLKAAERDKPRGYTDFRKMMEKEKLDGILVVTAPCDHADVVVPVLEAGFNCFAEKPMDITVEKCDAITKAARKAKGFYQIGTQRRSHPTYQAAMKFIHDGLLGKVSFMQGGWHWSGDPSAAPVPRDGGRLIEQASHHMDVMAWVMKDVAPLSCVSMARADEDTKPNEFSETKSATVFQFPGNVLFSYTHLFRLPGKFDKEILLAFGDKGAIDFNEALYTGRDEKEHRFGPPIGKAWDQGTPESLIHFVDNIKKGNKTPWANVETGRICSLMCIMGRMAHVNAVKNAYEPAVVKWKDLGTTTDL
ncbi:MAG TPA: Gfo/Idh/MocA family oxidoreductase [Phycisphaerae bacterium]|nr:Gfo/Idh/MocA family oxidoreductase [Phycisphaerae bacterium]HOJ73562.1 Gfo/Idh/MocA family oxidoreductase [Phycisphaerae bacterium]HOM51630.1 Gfo/Idh/MocA family oxidoreductase [Phycisphaerae bacterium]HON65396.1 Gfo/Idh/MocA family oxidoreductase [Phycisphaerae bacterium]HOQ85376.1 Gfo/Idh/MocA family oxidoreductase [Phycisphaerae bacterium]